MNVVDYDANDTLLNHSFQHDSYECYLAFCPLRIELLLTYQAYLAYPTRLIMNCSETQSTFSPEIIVNHIFRT